MRECSRARAAGSGLTGLLLLALITGGQAAEERLIYVAMVEPKGSTTVDKEPYPPGELPQGGGYVKKAPDPTTGRWEVSAYQFSPATVVARQGERVVLELVGINGAKHTVWVERYHPGEVVVGRGEIARLAFVADTPGLFRIRCKEHQPTMEGTLVVLPR